MKLLVQERYQSVSAGRAHHVVPVADLFHEPSEIRRIDLTPARRKQDLVFWTATVHTSSSTLAATAPRHKRSIAQTESSRHGNPWPSSIHNHSAQNPRAASPERARPRAPQPASQTERTHCRRSTPDQPGDSKTRRPQPTQYQTTPRSREPFRRARSATKVPRAHPHSPLRNNPT